MTANDCAAKTRYGTFNGFVDERSVKTWLGISYAQLPVNKLRRQASQSLKPSNKSFDENLYSGTNFVSAQDVVLVFLNYRLNVFGFMNFAAIDSAFEVPAPFQPCC